MDRRHFLASAGLAITGFVGIDKALGGGVRPGEIHAWVGRKPLDCFSEPEGRTMRYPSVYQGWFFQPNGEIVRYHSHAEMEALEAKWAGWKTIFLLDIGHVAYQWRIEPEVPQGWESAGEMQLGRCLLVLSPAGIRYWVMETNLHDTSSRIHREDFKKRDAQPFPESLQDMDAVEIAAMTLFKERRLMPGRDYEDTIAALKEDWCLFRDGKHEYQGAAHREWRRKMGLA